MNHSDKTVTIKSIAEALGVSFSTVSKALNGDPNVSEKTRLRVEKAAKEMNYTRNYFAKNLREQNSRTVAIIANDFEIPAYSEMINAISVELFSYGYTTLLCDSQYSEQVERNSIRTVLARMPEAVIFSPAHPASKNLRLLEGIYDRTLVLGDTRGIASTNCAAVNHRLAGNLSAGHMLDCGTARSLIFAGPEGYQSSELFLAGVRDAYRERGASLREDDIFRFRPDLPMACNLYKKLRAERPEACGGVVCFCDSMALGIYRAAAELHLSIPQDVSVIGYDDSPVNDFTAPPLTSIHMPKDKIAASCTEFLAGRLLRGDETPYVRTLEPYLNDRGSVRKK